MSPRPYRLGRREASVADTRERILSAARDVLGDNGFSGFTVDAVADRAGVARMTVYYQFQSKGALLDALLDALAAAGLVDRLTSNGIADPSAALTEFIAAFVGFWASDRIVIRRLRCLAGLDREVEAAVAVRDSKRRAALRPLVARVMADRRRPTGTAIDETTDVLQTLTSFETFDALAGRTRSPEDVAAILIRVAHAAITTETES